MKIERDVPVRHEVDVFVAGGGPAGCAAAVVAARQGRSVFLAEAHSCFGGMGTAGLVPAFMQFSDGEHLCAAGLGEEILETLRAAGGTGTPKNLAIKAEVLKRVYDGLVTDAGVDFTFHTALIDVATDGDRVSHAVCAAKSGIFAVEAKMFVDGTGDGDLAAWAGAPFEKGDENGDLMPGTLCSLWADVDWETVRSGGGKPERERVSEAIADGVLSQEDYHLPGMWRVGENVGGGNIGHTFGVDNTDERSITEALIRGRELVPEYEQYYKEYLDGYEEMKLMATGSLLGIRESRRITGDYVLCIDDFKERATFDDEIGRYSYPVDIHPTRPGREEFERFTDEWETLRYKKGENYGIPYRSLTPQGLANVLVAGRCISADRAMQGSVRVMPGCYITGQAAGMAAAIAAEQDTSARGFGIGLLQGRLKEIGAFLPNC
ncbi:MAG: FAD-dependent oxidoreductase [Planctomycetota bacterium]